MSYKITEACNGCGACVRICPTNAISGEKKSLHHIDEKICIDCGACGRICPNNGIVDANGKPCVMVKRSQWEKPSFKVKDCMSCNICIENCPVACLALREPATRKNTHGYPYLKNEKACIACGFCAQDCPVNSVEMVAPAKPAVETATGK